MNENGLVILRLEEITKSFSGVCVLDHVSFDIMKGEVHCILGENGAGKSTLIKIISGAYHKDFGKIIFDGQEININDAKTARDCGIGTIYQENSLVPSLDTVANIFLGEEIVKEIKGCRMILDYQKMEEKTLDTLKRLGTSFNIHTPVKYLTTAQQQIIEIARAITFENKVIIMDEPTSSLSGKDVDELFRIINQLKQQGVAIIFISHKLDEIQSISDRVTILRDGKYISTVRVNETSIDELVNMMVGREFDTSRSCVPRESNGEVVLEVKNIVSSDGMVKDVSFKLHKGTILGFAGLVGAGRTELMKVIFGHNPMESGEIHVRGKKINKMSTSKAVSLGISYLTEDRKREGLVLQMPIKKNVTMAKLKKICTSGILMDLKKEESDTQDKVRELNVITSSIEKEARYLSGGNQQKVVVAKWLYAEGDILIFDEPTRGIDVGARSEIYDIMNRLANEGKSIIMVSSDLNEVLSMSNRIVTMHEGKITGELENTLDVTQDVVMKLMLGGM